MSEPPRAPTSVPTSVPVPVPAVPTSSTSRILVIDDDADLRLLLEMVLSDAGYRVLLAQDGQEGLLLLHAPDHVTCILLDMRMPVMDGWQFARAYHALPPPRNNAPIVVCTAAEAALRSAAEVGARHAIGKPFSIDQLLATVCSAAGPPARA